MTIGKTLKKLRLRNSLTQKQVAEYLGITYQAVSGWEHDKALPDIVYLVPLARLYGITVDVLLRGEAEKEQEEVL
ncbi:MAG: helix-turn-helix transcriptional regulator [Clostridia bacterium]|nr:helix-turn-helix transcriptional regulator [Clostridia bacterium]